MEAMVAMMVLASIIDTCWFVFGFVFVSGNCLSDFSLISISIFRLGKSEIEDMIEDMWGNEDDYFAGRITDTGKFQQFDQIEISLLSLFN